MDGEIRILLVEDDAELSMVTALRLRNSGFDVACALNGEQAIEILKNERVNLILLDVLLPDTDGHALCDRIRSAEIGYGGPIIFMSCLGDSTNIVDAFRKGGNDYIVKPARLDDLLERIWLAYLRAPLDTWRITGDFVSTAAITIACNCSMLLKLNAGIA